MTLATDADGLRHADEAQPWAIYEAHQELLVLAGAVPAQRALIETRICGDNVSLAPSY